MWNRTFAVAVLAGVVIGAIASPRARGEMPPPLKDSEMAEFPMAWTPDAPGAFDAAPLLDKPAGRSGPVVARDGHFYTGDKRVRFWGVNTCFAANFPTHEQADRVAARLAHFGVNAVRFHHMDNQRFPNGIFADAKLETLSEEALDRLDYFIAALKKNGVYADLNLHVSRPWGKTHDFPNIDQVGESYDKIIDLFNPEIIAANKRYARDLLTHVNKYTGTAYASEPAVGMVEINNENTLFLWGGEQAVAKLPEPYAGMLNKLWNDWLVKRYGGREKLAAAWGAGAVPLGTENLLAGGWGVEAHDGAGLSVRSSGASHVLTVSKVTGTEWHAQFSQPRLKLAKGAYHTLTFKASADRARKIAVGAAQAHAPWNNLGLSAQVTIGAEPKAYRFGFTATGDDENARISFSVGQATGTVTLADLELRTGGQEGLREGEDPFAGKPVSSHAPGDAVTAARNADWFLFLQQTDQAYWVDMRNYLKDELKLVAPVTGTIGIGPLGTLSQTKMDYVDAHAYWEHPRFPHRPWDPKDWLIENKSMADNPDGSTLWRLAAIRVAGKPFTVTEYNNSAPNQWQAEGTPMVAAYAATQDWDAVYIFSFSHSNQFERTYSTSFFDIEGNPLKMLAMPVAARLFLGQGVRPSAGAVVLPAPIEALLKDAPASYYDAWSYARRVQGLDWTKLLNNRAYTVFETEPGKAVDLSLNRPAQSGTLAWTKGAGAGTGRFTLGDSGGALFAGFAAGGPMPVAMGDVSLTSLETPFATIAVVPADPKQAIKTADRLLVFAAARGGNTGMKWNPTGTSVGSDWGKAPTRIETVKATLALPADYAVRALDSAGKVIGEFKTAGRSLRLGEGAATVWYELVRE